MDLPGAYPVSEPPTPYTPDTSQNPPQHQLHHPAEQHTRQQTQRQPSSQLAREYKPEDTKGHSHTDSGIGLLDQDPSQPQGRQLFENKPVAIPEAVGGGTYERPNNNNSLGSEAAGRLGYVRQEQNVVERQDHGEKPTQRQQDYVQPVQRYHQDVRAANRQDQAVQSAETQHHDVGRHEQQPYQAIQTAPPPQESHRIRHSSDTAGSGTSGKSSSTPYWGDLPTAATGGIYNTVTGHGSANDDHDQHHHIPEKRRSPERETVGSAVSGAAAHAPFPTGGVYNTVTGHGSQDEHAKQHEHDMDKNHQREVPTTKTGLAGSVPAAHQDSSRSGETALIGAESSAAMASKRSTHDDTVAQRTFPLSTSNPKQDETQESSKLDQTAKGGMAAGAMAGTGTAAYALANKRGEHHGDDAQDMTTEGTPRHMGQKNEHAVAPSASQGKQSSEMTRTSMDRKDKRGSDSSDNGKHHGVLGIFHRKKTVKKEESPKSKHHRDDSAERRKLHKEPPASVVMASRAEKSASPERKHHAEDTDKHHSGAVAGIFHSHNDSHKDNHKESPVYRSEGSQPNERHTTSAVEHPKTTLDSREKESPTTGHTSRAEPAVAAIGAGVAGGLAASELARRHYQADNSHATRDSTNTRAAQNPSQFEHAQAELSHPTGPQNAQSNQSGPYNALDSGTPSGVAAGAAQVPRQTTAAHPSNRSEKDGNTLENRAEPYNTLSSGTPSGVADAAAARALQGTTTSSSTAGGNEPNKHKQTAGVTGMFRYNSYMWHT